MSQLKQTTDELVNQLQKAEAVIDAVSRRLEDEFSERFSKSTTVNPMLLAKRLQKVAVELPALQHECQEVLKIKQASMYKPQDLIDSTKRHLVANHTKLQALCTRSGLAPSSAQEDQEILVGFEHAVQEWDKQIHANAISAGGAAGGALSRDELNTALAGLALSRA